MIINIFNIFDPSTRNLFSLNWLRTLIIFIILPKQFWLIPSRYNILWIKLINYIYYEFKTLINYSFSNIIIFICLFIFIITNNFFGLFPYIFTSSRHLRFSLSISLSIWITIIIYGWLNYTNDIFSHLTPIGTPSILIPFMVLIESISLAIRPITLSVRLTANIIAGHLLLSLLGSTGTIISFSIIIFLLLTQILLFILEISVSLIQAYVFSILSSLYRREI